MGSDLDDYDGLLHLLKAASKKTVIEILNKVASQLLRSGDDDVVGFLRSCLDIDADESAALFHSLTILLRKVIYSGCANYDAINAAFPSEFHKSLKELLIKSILDNHNAWKSQAIDEQVSLPRLKDFSWEVRKNVVAPSCVLHLNTSDRGSLNVEMSAESLDTMLDSLAKIRDQISSVTQ
ncbi:unnamed protein product [Clavelina lepadiformis]|uniref:COMM domain-containing protein n=1 Tax=Clavelina lepadiformis TaxID=159417 RepID=A0ABP0G9D8_CLALP